MALAAALAALIVFIRRRRGAPETQDWPEAENIPQPVTQPEAPAPAPLATGAAAESAPAPAPMAPQPAFPPAAQAPAAEPFHTTLSFEPLGLRLSLVYATLQYRLSITAGGDLPAGHLLGDMIGAHASIPTEQQLAPALDTLPLLKAVPSIAAGETVTLKGELQLPLSAIRPLQQGSASFFVPLVRLSLLLEGDEGQLALRRVYTVGIDSAAAALSPLRLDTGPREHRELAAREVEAARAYPLQPTGQRAAG